MSDIKLSHFVLKVAMSAYYKHLFLSTCLEITVVVVSCSQARVLCCGVAMSDMYAKPFHLELPCLPIASTSFRQFPRK